MLNLQRREFLKSTAALGAGLVLPWSLSALESKKQLFDISLAQWSLHKAFFSKKLDPVDFAKIAKEEYGILGVEYVNQFYKDKKKDDGYVKDLRKRCDDLGVRSVLIMCDGEGALGDADEKKRKTAVNNHVRWIEWAKALGCHSIRVNAQSSGTYEEQMGRAADGLHQLCEIGDKHEINVIVENHGGLSSNGEWLAATIKKALQGSGRVDALRKGSQRQDARLRREGRGDPHELPQDNEDRPRRRLFGLRRHRIRRRQDRRTGGHPGHQEASGSHPHRVDQRLSDRWVIGTGEPSPSRFERQSGMDGEHRGDIFIAPIPPASSQVASVPRMA